MREATTGVIHQNVYFSNMRSMKWNYFLIIVGSALSNCGNIDTRKSGKGKAIEVPVIKLKYVDTSLQKRYVTRIQASQNVEIRNKVDGYLETIFVDEGDQVKKGQLLFSINTEEYQTEVSKAKAALSNAVAEAKEAEVKLIRVQQLVEKNVISKSELDVAKAKYNSRLAKIEEAKSVLANKNTNLAYTNVRAPFDGTIDRIPYKMGSLLAQGSLLTTISDLKEVFAYFNMAEDEYLQYQRNKAAKKDLNNLAELELADGARYPHLGKIETSTSEFNEGTGSITFRARFSNPQRILHHGSSGEIIITNKVENVLLLPHKSAFEIQDRNYIYVVDSTGLVRMKSFKPASRLAGFYIVQSGLKEGDIVVYEGIQNIKEGSRIIPQLRSVDELMDEDEDARERLLSEKKVY